MTLDIDALDLPVWGVREIAPLIRRSPRQTYELLEKGLVPARKAGKVWMTSRRQLLAFVNGAEE